MTLPKIGFGYDIHRLSEGEELWIGGFLVPHTKGSIGHSDADVLIHAICDALLGALALGDIGKHFPDTDPKWKNADSKQLLQQIHQLIREKGYLVGNIDSTVVLEKPKLRPYIDEMRMILANILQVELDCVSIKATTSEKMSYVGNENGVKAYATCLLFPIPE